MRSGQKSTKVGTAVDSNTMSWSRTGAGHPRSVDWNVRSDRRRQPSPDL